MHLYLAGLPSSKRMMQFVLDFNEDKALEEKIGVMTTFSQPKLVDRAIEWGFEKIFLDSGAFTVFNSGGTVDIDSLIDFIKERKEKLTHYIALDVIDDKVGTESLANWDYMKNKDIDPIPVYHAGEEWSVFTHYYENSDYVGLGGMAGVSGNWKSWIPFLSRIFTNYSDKKYHAMGVNDFKLCQRYPWYSVDALTWRSGSRFGQIITPYGRWWINGRNTRAATSYDVQSASLVEWLASYDIPYPLPEDYDFNLLDEVNIKVLWEHIVKYHLDGELEKVPGNASLF